MIYTLTYSPTIDYLMFLDDFQQGKLNLSEREKYYYGGKGINVSQVLSNLGVENTALGFVAGFTGNEIESGLNKMGIKTDFIHLSSGNSRINVKLRGQEETEINALGPDIDENSMAMLYEKLQIIGPDDILVLSGRRARGLESDVYARVMQNLPYRDTKVVVDTSGETLLNAIAYSPFLIKPNLAELTDLFHQEFSSSDMEFIGKAAKKLQKLGARNVLVSLAEDGALLLTEQGDKLYAPAPAGVVVNSVGAGDSMIAGFIAQYTKTGNYEDALVMGIAAGTMSTFQEGLASGDEIEQLYRLIR